MTVWFCLFSSLFIFALVWAFIIEPNLLKVTRYQIKQPLLKGVKIVFASDFHLAPSHKKRLIKIIDTINAQSPDIVLLGGDFIKNRTFQSSMSLNDMAKQFVRIQAKYGVYTVLGNHDWYVDGYKIIDVFSKINIKVLLNENIKLSLGNIKMILSGIEDMYKRTPDLKKTLPETNLPIILLSHEPDVFSYVSKKVFLTLSGHMHGGQVRIPYLGALIVPSPMGRRFARGLFEKNGNYLLVSSGLGTSLLSVRFNACPEIVVVDFI